MLCFGSAEPTKQAQHFWDRLLGSYPDAHLSRLVGAASAALNLSPDAIVCWTGRRALPLLAVRYPHFFTPHTRTREFVLTLNDIIHPEVRKLYPGADVPEFVFDTSCDDILVMHYNSARKMCAFAQGLIEGAAAHFGEKVSFQQSKCMLRGDTECVFEIAFQALAAQPQDSPRLNDFRKAA